MVRLRGDHVGRNSCIREEPSRQLAHVTECSFLIDCHFLSGRFCEIEHRGPADGLRGVVRGDPGGDGVGSGAGGGQEDDAPACGL